ncbi:Spermidine/putrescine import ATP-binding protein PotA [bacterium HR07]|uniref:Spermidine/putrescine import ATP-binding protein PotA n=2 Tax=Candidatus Bipolaricaulota TaxID=67810 RepID=H5SF84_9BACT|nr:ABC transport system ATP-binding protein [uncultured Acetothermia bacterium]BAL58600.1 ABC transport system ATP-binding protein [Candidatus Acetothermum autotrophicum]GBC76006.1 Spermidine/putrescine import ATP-binding protein PotA [bacterium HR07]
MRVTLKEITKRFGTVVALEDISLDVSDGELLALVGPSGCGKTTLLRLIAGFEAPDAGDILFDGQSILGVPPERRGVGLVFQNYALFPHMTVFHNIAYGLKFVPLPSKGIQSRVRELLELVGLAGLEGRMPSELSAGQQQRVALARALAPHPKVLLLDEPLSALDAKLRERLRLEIKRIQRALKITTLYVTHDQEEALAVADRVAVMSVGHIEQIGTPHEVYHTPKTEFVARFIGRGNLFTGQVVRRDGESVLLAVGESTIRARAPHDIEIGQSVTVLVRPERIQLTQAAENTLAGKIVGLEFAGDAVWLHVEAAGSTLIVKANTLNDTLREGAPVRLGFSASDVYIVPSDRRSPPTP